MSAEVVIRSATVNDAKDLLAIYAYYVTNTAISFEYDVPVVEEFANRIAKALQKYPYLVAVVGGRLSAISMLHRSRSGRLMSRVLSCRYILTAASKGKVSVASCTER